MTNKRSTKRNKERNKKAIYVNELCKSSKGADPYGIPNVNFSILTDSNPKHKSDVESLTKYKNQRIERGFDDTETWNLDSTMAKFILPRLKRFKELHNGYPANLTPEQYDLYLDKMIYAFEQLSDEDASMDELENVFGEDNFKIGDSSYAGAERNRDVTVEEGLQLFAEYFQSLWW